MVLFIVFPRQLTIYFTQTYSCSFSKLLFISKRRRRVSENVILNNNNKSALLIALFAVKSQELNYEDATQRGWTASILKAHSSHTTTGYRHIHNGSRFTAHVRPRSTAPQPDGISWESILLREENRSTRRKTHGVRLRLINLSSHVEPGSRTRVVDLRQPDSLVHSF